jgi:hypothetical protein
MISLNDLVEDKESAAGGDEERTSPEPGTVRLATALSTKVRKGT